MLSVTEVDWAEGRELQKGVANKWKKERNWAFIGEDDEIQEGVEGVNRGVMELMKIWGLSRGRLPGLWGSFDIFATPNKSI